MAWQILATIVFSDLECENEFPRNLSALLEDLINQIQYRKIENTCSRVGRSHK